MNNSDKIIRIVFEQGQVQKRAEVLTEWDYGQVLEVHGLDIPNGVIEVDFSLSENDGAASTFFGTVENNVITVNIPDFMFQNENTYDLPQYEAYAFIYLSDGVSGKTIRKIIFPIRSRPSRTTDVPKDKKDEFLQEVRSIMQETKDIAQSVRDDADNGAFDGEKGPKGDAGSVHFLVVNELPQENIDESAIYLLPFTEVKKDEDENLVFNNNFREYIYVDGAWECIGSATVEVNLDEYVKNTDYASNDNFGVVKTNSKYGIQTDNGVLFIKRATDGEIDLREQQWAVITPKNLDYAVMKALSDSKLEWTDEEKQLARTSLGSVGSSDYATQDVGGVVKVSNLDYGVEITTNGILRIRKPSEWNILNGRLHALHSPVTLATVDLIVKEALKNPQVEWTDEEKAKALELLGGVGIADFATPDKPGIITVGNSNGLHMISKQRIGIFKATGENIQKGTHEYQPIVPSNQHLSVFYGLAKASQTDGLEYTDEEKQSISELFGGVQKKYVDDLVGNIETLLGGI